MTEKKKQSVSEAPEQALNDPRGQIGQALTGVEPERNMDEELETAIDDNEAREKILKKLGVDIEGRQSDGSYVSLGESGTKDRAKAKDRARANAEKMIEMILGKDTTAIADDDIKYIKISGGNIMAGVHGKKIPVEPEKAADKTKSAAKKAGK